MGWKNHTSKQDADLRKQRRVIECSLVKYRIIRVIRKDPRVIRVRALLGYRIEEASESSDDRARATQLCSQASDSMWRMPGHTEAMKAVVSCDKPRGAAHTLRSLDGRMGKPGHQR